MHCRLPAFGGRYQNHTHYFAIKDCLLGDMANFLLRDARAALTRRRIKIADFLAQKCFLHFMQILKCGLLPKGV